MITDGTLLAVPTFVIVPDAEYVAVCPDTRDPDVSDALLLVNADLSYVFEADAPVMVIGLAVMDIDFVFDDGSL